MEKIFKAVENSGKKILRLPDAVTYTDRFSVKESTVSA